MRSVDQRTTDSARSADSVLVGLDKDQRAAVTAPVGVVVVRAGAGSGKTTVLTRRIAWRAASGTADIERTLAITFTRQAATEMRTRLAQFDLDGRPTIGTFHAVARRMMIQHLQDSSKQAPVIMNNRSSLVSVAMGDDARKGGIAEVLNAIDWAHSRMLSPNEAPSEMSRAGIKVPLGDKRFAEVFEAYEKLKRKRGAVDLNDFLTYVVQEAGRNRRFADSLRFQFRHVSVDEAQDMNPLQFAFVSTLVADDPDLFLVGDPNQAIYGFNGADRTLFDALPGIASGAHVVSLPSNYRCTPEIVRFAADTLVNQGQAIEAHSRRGSGAPVVLRRHATDDDEVSHLERSVQQACISQPARTIAVLCRTNNIADGIRDALTRAGIPVASSRRGGEWSRAVADATALTGRESLRAWSNDILDSGDYSPDDADHQVATLVRRFLDDNRVGSVDGRTFGSWLATSADMDDADGVEVLTFHAAKGREWSSVFIVGCEKGLLPHRSARGPEARAEEVRLAYVACTRAADRLTISWSDKRGGKAAGPSPLLPSLTTQTPVAEPPTEEFRTRRRTGPSIDPLQSALEEWRMRRARQGRVHPDIVLSTRQLRAIVRLRPATIASLSDATDAMFAARHGEEILRLVREAPRVGD